MTMIERNAGLVICSEYCRAVCCDQSTAFQFRKMREGADFQYTAAVAKHNVSAVIVFMDHRNDVMVAEIGNRVHVSDESHLRAVFITRCCRNLSVYIALIVHMSLHAQLFQFVYQNVREIKLAFGRWNSFAVLIAWCPDNDVF